VVEKPGALSASSSLVNHTSSGGAEQPHSAAPAASPSGALVARPVARFRFTVLTTTCTLVLIFAGGLVTSTESGLSVPDWPLSYGMLMPPMVGGVFYEHGHRMIASAVGFLTLVLALWTARVESRSYVRRWTWLGLGTVIAQGVLGGLTVLYFLPTGVSVAHACLAQTFFCILIGLAYMTSQEWVDGGLSPTHSLRRPALAATLAVYVQLLIGALMRHLDAGLAIPDFPLAFGGLLPPFDSLGVVVHFAHRLGALLVLVLIARLFFAAQGAPAPPGRSLSQLILALAFVQVGLGATTIWTQKAVVPTTFHVATGAAILGLCWLLTLRTWRLSRPLAPAEAQA